MRNLECLADQAIAHCGDSGILLIQTAVSLFHRNAQPDDRRNIFRSRAASAFLCAALDQILQPDSFVHIQQADALLRVKFMTGKRKQVNLLFMHVDRHVAGCLNRIRVKQNSMLVADVGKLVNRLDCTDFVICVHDGHERGIVPQGRFQLFRANQTAFVNI